MNATNRYRYVLERMTIPMADAYICHLYICLANRAQHDRDNGMRIYPRSCTTPIHKLLLEWQHALLDQTEGMAQPPLSNALRNKLARLENRVPPRSIARRASQALQFVDWSQASAEYGGPQPAIGRLYWRPEALASLAAADTPHSKQGSCAVGSTSPQSHQTKQTPSPTSFPPKP